MFSRKPRSPQHFCLLAMLLAVTPANAATRGLSQPNTENSPDVSIEMMPAHAATRGLLSQARTENSSDVSIETTAGRTVDVGTEMLFRVSVSKPGYIMLVDIDSQGKMSQIYPRPELLSRFNKVDINLVKPGDQIQIPSDEQKRQGFKYVVSPPTGSSAVVVILSEKRVQLLDLPEVLQGVKTQADMISALSKWMDELRIPDATGKLVQTNWSIAVKPYSIK
jgi:Domain of unknown function (DUF4384)